MIEKSDLVGIIENAFKPLKCVAKLQEFNTAIGFRVSLPEGGGITYKNPNADSHLNEHVLDSVIRGFRTEVETKGIALDKWSLPSKE